MVGRDASAIDICRGSGKISEKLPRREYAIGSKNYIPAHEVNTYTLTVSLSPPQCVLVYYISIALLCASSHHGVDWSSTQCGFSYEKLETHHNGLGFNTLLKQNNSCKSRVI